MHLPLIVERSGSTTRWRLMDGYRHVPQLAFSGTELMALVFSRDLLKPLQGTSLKDSLDSALNKAEATLPRDALNYILQMQGYFSVGLGPHRAYRQHQRTIDQLMRAIRQTRTIQMRYYSASRDRVTRRNVDPYRLWYSVGALYLIGYCHIRKDVRLFAVERIRSLNTSNRPCQMPLGFDLLIEAYVRDAVGAMRGPLIEIELLFNRATAAWVKDQTWHSSQRLTALKDRRLKMVLESATHRNWLDGFCTLALALKSFARNRFGKKSGMRLKKFFRICDTGCHTCMRSFECTQ